MHMKREKQASQFLKPAPAKLAALIKKVNLLPPGQKLSDLAEMLEGVQYGDDEWLEVASRALKECLTDTPPSFNDYIFPEQFKKLEPGKALFHAVKRYLEFDSVRERLQVIARFSTEGELNSLVYYWEGISHQLFMVDDDGMVFIEKDPFNEAMEEGVEASRIRECEVCKRIFWAGRTDMRCCSTLCAKRLRTRRWRENYQTRYKYRRFEREKKLEAKKRQDEKRSQQ